MSTKILQTLIVLLILCIPGILAGERYGWITPVHAQDMSAMNAANTANQMMLQAAGAYDSPKPAPAKPKPKPQVIVVPAGTKVVYAQPARKRFTYTTASTPHGKKQVLVDTLLGVACYDNLGPNDDVIAQGGTCVYLPSLKTSP